MGTPTERSFDRLLLLWATLPPHADAPTRRSFLLLYSMKIRPQSTVLATLRACLNAHLSQPLLANRCPPSSNNNQTTNVWKKAKRDQVDEESEAAMEAAIKLWKEFLEWGLYEGIRPLNAAQLLHALFNACDKHEKHWPTVSGAVPCTYLHGMWSSVVELVRVSSEECDERDTGMMGRLVTTFAHLGSDFTGYRFVPFL